MARWLYRFGVDTRIHTMDICEWDSTIARIAGIDFSRLSIVLGSPAFFQPLPGRMWGYTMYESTVVPKKFIENINDSCERLIVPCQWCADVFRNSGVRENIPIHVVPGGIEPEEFTVMRRVANRPYTFLAWGDRGGRKGHDLVWRAFYNAFGDNPDVRLIIKTRRHEMLARMMDMTNSDPRLSLWMDDIQSPNTVFHMADCFVFPSRGEGYGLPPREAAATGMPVIAPRHTGLADGIENYAIVLEKTTLAKAWGLNPDDEEAYWYEPDIDELTERMKWCYENQDVAADIGLKAARWIRENQTWEKATQKLLEVIKLLA
jgi:glycosyltransferase involved in cell wall biosynthesis